MLETVSLSLSRILSSSTWKFHEDFEFAEIERIALFASFRAYSLVANYHSILHSRSDTVNEERSAAELARSCSFPIFSEYFHRASNRSSNNVAEEMEICARCLAVFPREHVKIRRYCANNASDARGMHDFSKRKISNNP